MAKIPAGILGRVSGKVGDIVGASWKGIAYIRQYVIPANPNTAAQQVERTAFSDLVSLAKTLLGSILQVYWDPFLKSNSGWAHFIGLNRKLYTTPDDYSTVHIAEGILEATPIVAAGLAGSLVTIAWSATALGNGSATDPAILFVYDEVNKVGFTNDSYTRTDATGDVNVGPGRTPSELNAFLFFTDSTTDPTMISFSDHSDVI
jgi:hypothetical protein